MHKLLDRIIKSVKRNIEQIGFDVFAILLSLILVRIVLVMLYYNGIPPNLFHDIGLTHGICPDQFEYFRVALCFSKFEFAVTQYPIGLPSLLVPFIYVFHANTLADIFMPVSVFNSIILYSASILLIYGIANKITGDNKISLLASILWVILSYKLGCMWVYVSSEPPMIFVVLLAIYLYLRGRESVNIKYPFFVGMLAAFGVMFRMPCALFVLFFALMYAFERKFKHCIIFLISTLIFLVPQFVYNNIAYHAVTKTGYTATGSATHWFNIKYLVPFFDQIFNGNWIYSLFGLLIFSTIGILYLFIVCKDKFKIFFLASWLYSSFAFYSVMSWCLAALGRYLMPSYPAVVICIASFIVIGFNSIKVIIVGLLKGEKKDVNRFIIVIVPVLYLLFASIAPTNILSECHTLNIENAENEALEYSGWYVTSTGLWLKPNTSGVLVYEIETKEYPYLYLYPLSFYNPGANRLEISTNGGRTYGVILENKSITGHRLNITEYTRDSPSFILRLSASNSGTSEKMVIRTIYIRNLRYPQ